MREVIRIKCDGCKAVGSNNVLWFETSLPCLRERERTTQRDHRALM